MIAVEVPGSAWMRKHEPAELKFATSYVPFAADVEGVGDVVGVRDTETVGAGVDGGEL
jgi:hypothetical protein